VKALVVADKVVESLYTPTIAERFGDVDLVLSCGDLPYYYLEYIVSMLNVPLLYVHGNHDTVEHTYAGGVHTEPGGGTNMHGRLVLCRGLAVAGLEGSMRYRPWGEHQYTDGQMWGNALWLAPALLRYRLFTGRSIDILLAHGPPYLIHDGRDPTHVGFKAFLWLMRVFKPRYLLHGHRHVYNPLEATVTQYDTTTIINVYPYRLLNLDIEGGMAGLS
jgi:Icc-related predicted phosphoesterase